ncbi:MAG: hypothetical protein J1F16_05805 [Muribaculaceae bacterium]|nr:hypothetical protein [Muribaculaceae bacterium]
MILHQARECYEQLSTFRRKRNRCRDYTYGRQWNDPIEVNGRCITEYEYIISEGNVPLKNNLIRRIVRNVLGVFRQRLPEIMNQEYQGPLESVALSNSLEELFCRSMEEFLISGMVIHRKRLGYHGSDHGIWTESVSPGSFFFNTDSRDIRGWDLNLAGQLHKVDYNDWCRAFVSTPQDLLKARSLFENGVKHVTVWEVWRREMVPCNIVHDTQQGKVVRLDVGSPLPDPLKDMPHKWTMTEVWRYYFLTDDGTVLLEGDSPYLHGSHPYIIKSYPYLEGEIHSFVADMIDQQRYTNRLVTLYDWVIRASAKGVLLIPEGSVDPRNLHSVSDQWGRFNGVILYKAKPGNPEPRQISGNLSNLGISELLEIQLKMMEDVSGVNGILQGNTSGGNVSGTLYNSQTTNALYSLSDLMETFRTFIRENASADRILLRQCHGKEC